MLIWLGKQYLGQRDISEIRGEGGGAISVKIIVESEESKKNLERTAQGERT